MSARADAARRRCDLARPKNAALPVGSLGGQTTTGLPRQARTSAARISDLEGLGLRLVTDQHPE